MIKVGGETNESADLVLAPLTDTKVLANLVRGGRARTILTSHPVFDGQPVETKDDGGAWGDPVPFLAGEELSVSSVFPVGALPPKAREMALAVSRFVQVDVSLAAQTILGVASAAIAHKVVITERDWREESNLWVVGAAGSGERKSATQRLVARPLREVERERQTLERTLIAEAEAHLEMLKAQYADQVKIASKATGEQRVVEETAVRELAGRLADAEAGRASETRLTADDITAEYLGSALADNNPLLLISAEGGLLDNFTGRYSNIPNLDLLNGSYSGDPYSPGRTTRKAEPIERPILCMALLPQPIVIAGLATNQILIRRGTLSRFLYWFAAPMAGKRSPEARDLDPTPVDAWGLLIRDLLSLPSTDDPYIVMPTDSASRVLEDYRRHAEKLLATESSDAMRSWLNRASGHQQRLACVLHFLEHGSAGTLQFVSEETAEAAATLIRAYEHHARIAFNLMDEVPVINRARAVLEWIVRSRVEETTVREVLRAHRGLRANEMREALAELEARDWLKVKTGLSGPKGGRPSEIVTVNPIVAERTVETVRTPTEDDQNGVPSVLPRLSPRQSSPAKRPMHRGRTAEDMFNEEIGS